MYDQFGVAIHLIQSDRLIQLVLRRNRARIVVFIDPLHRKQLNRHEPKRQTEGNKTIQKYKHKLHIVAV